MQFLKTRKEWRWKRSFKSLSLGSYRHLTWTHKALRSKTKPKIKSGNLINSCFAANSSRKRKAKSTRMALKARAAAGEWGQEVRGSQTDPESVTRSVCKAFQLFWFKPMGKIFSLITKSQKKAFTLHPKKHSSLSLSLFIRLNKRKRIKQ